MTVAGALLEREIAEQPSAWQVLSAHHEPIDAAAALLSRSQPELLAFVARGSSDHAAMYGQYLAHNVLGIPSLLSTPSTVTAFGTELTYPKRTVVLAVSQSGESPDLLETVAAAKRGGVPVIAITNNDSSSLATLADVHVPIMAGAELSVAATKTYTGEVLALYLVLSRAADRPWHELESQVAAAASAASSVAQRLSPLVDSLARSLVTADRLLVVGRGYSMSTAKEGALKLMETNALAASGWSAADATHGPLGQVVEGTPVIVLTASPGGRESVETFAAAVKGLGGRIVEIGGEQISGEQLSLDEIGQSGLEDALIPVVEIIPLQMLALSLSRLRGRDADRPRGLNKVTRTS